MCFGGSFRTYFTWKTQLDLSAAQRNPRFWETPHVCGNRFAQFLTVEAANAEIRVCVGRFAQKLIPTNLNLRVSMVGYVCVLGAKQAMF